MPEDESSDSPILRRYYDLRQYLGIKLVDIDLIYERMLGILQQASELAADADAVENAAKHTLDIIKAEAGIRIRSGNGGKEPSEAKITALLPAELDVQDARAALDKSRYEAQICASLYKSLETQSRLLPKAADMVLSTYMSPSAAYEERRAELRKARIAAEQQKAPHLGRPVD